MSIDLLRTHLARKHKSYTRPYFAEDTEYQTYFKTQLKKHGYDSPSDIPDDKKDDFFNTVDAGWKAKSEGTEADADVKIELRK